MDKLDKMDEHLDMIISAPLFYNLDDCFISHSGISKSIQDKLPQNYLYNDLRLDEILKNDLFNQNSVIWARGELLNIGKLQVVGHTHRKEVFYDKVSNALYIDTTAYGNNKLASVIVDQNKLIDTLEEKTVIDDVNRNWTYNL
jgi:serine/threonine protein phosphatase 1